MSEYVTMRMGAFAPPIHLQLGCDDEPDEWATEQRLADAITMLAAHGLLAHGEVQRARERLWKRKILPKLQDADEVVASADLEGGSS